MRNTEVHLYGKLAGHLIQDEEDYTFTYTSSHLQAEFAQPISLTLPLREQHYVERILPFFDGLIPKGWLLEVSERN
jgi:serine/threonine-protein kinase HipA